jgi:hypothetical protein
MSSSSLSPRRLIGAAVVAACAAFAAQAEEFSWQLSGAKRHAEAGDSDLDSWAVDATYYMNPIADSAGPYALASFLNGPSVEACKRSIERDHGSRARASGADRTIVPVSLGNSLTIRT